MNSEVMHPYELPQGWAWTTMGPIAEYINGRAFKPSEWEKHGRPILRIQNLTRSSNTVNRYSKAIEEKYIVSNGDLLISWSATLGAYIYKGEQAVLNQHIFKVLPYIDKLFLFYLVTNYIRELKGKVHGTGMQHITKGKFENTAVPLPPLPEQHRIVAKIEELFTKLDAGVEALKKIKAQLKHYRQSVLKHAFEGKLTTEWRQAHKHELEPASVLLERIKHERQKTAKGKYKELPPPDIANLPGLPEGWVWTALGDIIKVLEMVTPRTKPEREFLYIDIASIDNKEQKIVQPKKYLGREAPSRARQLIRTGDVLFSTVRTYLKNIAMVTELYDGQIASTGFTVIRPHSPIANRLVFYWVQTDALLNQLTQLQRGTSYPAVRDSDVFARSVPLPPLPEQHCIVEEIERRFSVADQIEKTVDKGLKQAERLRQSILKRAFECKLVPQNPNDEPAEKLLERIRQERARQQAERKPAKSSRNKSNTKQIRLA